MILLDFNFSILKIYFYDNDRLVQSFEHPFWHKHPGVKLELELLIENGIIEATDSSYTVSIERIYESIESEATSIGDEENPLILSDSLIDFLRVPQICMGTLKIKSIHAFRSKNFQIIKSFQLADSNEEISNVTKPVITYSSGEEYLLQKEQCEACRLITEYLDSCMHNQEDKYRLGGELRRLSSLGNIEIIGGRLKKEKIEDIKSIRPIFKSTREGGLDIGLDIDSGNNEVFEKLVKESHPFQEIFTEQGEGTERTRFILNEDSKKAINSFRKKSHYDSDEKIKLLDEPDKYLEGFNLDDYGERVTGYGLLYAPKVDVFKDEDGIEWISLELLPLSPEGSDDVVESETNIIPLDIDKENAEELKALIEKSEASGHDSIIFKDQEIYITNELKKAINKIVNNEAEIANKEKAYALITKSNIDKTTYQEGVEETIAPPSQFNVVLPDILSSEYSLKAYQRNGFGWLNWARDNKYAGALLADDMGMGKTLQICTLMASLKTEDNLKTSLLILPPILMGEWEKEMQKIIPSVTFRILSRAVVEAEIEYIKSYDVIAITYQSLLKSQRVLGKIPFKLIVCDEAQFIKNPATARAQAVIAMNGEFKISSTATPIENSISELWSILDYSNPGYLPPLREFNKRYGERRVSDEEFNENIEELKNRLNPVVLRRTKDEYLKNELPEKIIKRHLCDIDEKQVMLCRKISYAFKHEKSVSNFLHFFQLIVMALTNPEILDGQFGAVFPTDYISPKLSKTLSLLESIKNNNEKTLIFADRKQVQGKLRAVIEEKFKIRPNIINGQTSAALRKIYIQPFEPSGVSDNKFNVLILSPRCAGFGLNLVRANHVIHYLRSFNPAVENQATDRVYRIGQEKPVHVHILVSSTNDPDLKYTVEQKLDEMIKRKQELLKDYLYTSRAGRITEEDLANELNINNPGLSLADIDKLTPLEFEKFTSVLYQKQGYQASLTSIQDYGADCIAVGHSEKSNALIQCKKKMNSSKSCIGNKAVQEIVAARKRYEEQMSVKFDQLAVITNGYFTDAAKIQANDNSVSLIDRKKLSLLLDSYVITQTDFENMVE